MTALLSKLYKESTVFVTESTGAKEFQYFDPEKFASMIVDIAVECVRDELRDPKSTLTYDQCSRIQQRIRDQFS